MIVEERCYTLHPGQSEKFLALYEAEGKAHQMRLLGRMAGYYRSEIGTLNQIVHLWAYRDLEERRQKRAALIADPDFHAYVQKILPLLIRQESRILTPAPFFKPLWRDASGAIAD